MKLFKAAPFFTKFWNNYEKYYENETKFNYVYSRKKLSKIKDEVFIINLDEYKSIGTHGIVFYVNNNKVTYFDSFGVENILK